jgi:hypothetical protein
VRRGQASTIDKAYTIFLETYSQKSNLGYCKKFLGKKAKQEMNSKAEKKILIFGHARSGTGLVRSLLLRSPLFDIQNELFSHKAQIENPYKLLKDTENNTTKKVFGFKLLIYQLKLRFNPPEDFLRYLYKERYQFIHVWRENLLDIAVSDMNAHIKDTFHYTLSLGKENERYQKIKIDTNQLLKRLAAIEHNHQLELDVLMGIPILRIIYENDLKDDSSHQATVDKICNYLALPSHKALTNIKKSIPLDLPKYILNYKEVEDALKNTKYYRYLVK